MKSPRDVLDEIRDAMVVELRKIDEDERFHYETATVAVNAPLALIQFEMEVRERHCKSVLTLLGYEGPEMDIASGPKKKVTT